MGTRVHRGFYCKAAPDPTGGLHQIVQCAMCNVQCMPEMQADKSSWPRLGITCMLGLANAMFIPTRLDLSQNSHQVGPESFKIL